MPPESEYTIDQEACRVFQRTAELAGKKWNAAILMVLAVGMVRCTELRHHVDGISDRLLAARLHDLETAGLIGRTVIPSTPVQVRYALTVAGAELMHVLSPLVDWARRWDPNPVIHS